MFFQIKRRYLDCCYKHKCSDLCVLVSYPVRLRAQETFESKIFLWRIVFF